MKIDRDLENAVVCTLIKGYDSLLQKMVMECNKKKPVGTIYICKDWETCDYYQRYIIEGL